MLTDMLNASHGSVFGNCRHLAHETSSGASQTIEQSLTVCDVQGVEGRLRVLFKTYGHMVASEVGLRQSNSP